MTPFARSLVLTLLGLFFIQAAPLWAQEDDLRFQVVDVRGKVMAYGDRLDATYRLKKGHQVDEGDKLTAGPKAEVVLRLKGKAYVHLSAKARIRISRLDSVDSKVRCQINLLSGRILVQLDGPSSGQFLVSAGDVLCRAHGTLFEVTRHQDDLAIVSFEGAVVANTKGRPQMAKAGQMLKFERDRFRYKRHNLVEGEEAQRQEWKDHLTALRTPKNAPKGPSKGVSGPP